MKGKWVERPDSEGYWWVSVIGHTTELVYVWGPLLGMRVDRFADEGVYSIEAGIFCGALWKKLKEEP